VNAVDADPAAAADDDDADDDDDNAMTTSTSLADIDEQDTVNQLILAQLQSNDTS